MVCERDIGYDAGTSELDTALHFQIIVQVFIAGNVMHRSLNGWSLAILVGATLICSLSPVAADWEACKAMPTRMCLLDQAMAQTAKLSSAQERDERYAGLAGLYASMGSLDLARRAALLTQPVDSWRPEALTPIASELSRSARRDEAQAVFAEAVKAAQSTEEWLERAEQLASIGDAERKAGFADDALLHEKIALSLLDRTALPAGAKCAFPTPQYRFDSLLQRLAARRARAGNFDEALRLARLVEPHLVMRAHTLRMIAEAGVRDGKQAEMKPILIEAQQAVLSAPAPNSCLSITPVAGDESFRAVVLITIAKVQARAGLRDDSDQSFRIALQFVPTLDSSHSATRFSHFHRSLLLSNIAQQQSESGFADEAGKTLARARDAASTLMDDTQRLQALVRLARSYHSAGRAAEVADLFRAAEDIVTGLSDASQRYDGLWSVADAHVELGLGQGPLAQAYDEASDITDHARRASALYYIAVIQEKAKSHAQALATFREALAAIETVPDAGRRGSSLMPILLSDPRRWPNRSLVVESMPQILGAIETIPESRRVEALLALAKALPTSR